MNTQHGTLGVLGAGEVGQAVAAKAVRHGHEVLIGNSRGPRTLEALVGRLGPKARAVTAEEAVKPELVFLSVPFFAVPELTRLTSWSGKIVVDTTNQFAAANPWRGRYDVGDLTGSEWVAQHLPGARLVKAQHSVRPVHRRRPPACRRTTSGLLRGRRHRREDGWMRSCARQRPAFP
ncbi:NADPH-dependent F420 reductase [Streptomyces avermitilis]|uniref:NADPH-dependent F420 reductase n=1 Tax=Streptomyces avermitilis TaxID=33903 RepID=UPI0033B14512